MAQVMRPEHYPLITRLLGGRVNHMALQLPGNPRVKTACGHIGLPDLDNDQHVSCQGCISAFAPRAKEPQ